MKPHLNVRTSGRLSTQGEQGFPHVRKHLASRNLQGVERFKCAAPACLLGLQELDLDHHPRQLLRHAVVKLACKPLPNIDLGSTRSMASTPANGLRNNGRRTLQNHARLAHRPYSSPRRTYPH